MAPKKTAKKIVKPTKTQVQQDKSIAKTLGVDQNVLMMALMGSGDVSRLLGLIKIDALLDMYEPTDPDNIAVGILQGKFGNEPVVAFKPGTREVAVQETAAYISDLRRDANFKQPSIYVGGRLVRLYPIGVVPEDFVQEDPMVVGKPLSRNRSTQYVDCDYAGVAFETMQLIRIAFELGGNRGGFDATVNADRRDVMNLAHKGFDALASAYPQAGLAFDERKASDTLPRLKYQIGTGGAASSAPFFGR